MDAIYALESVICYPPWHLQGRWEEEKEVISRGDREGESNDQTDYPDQQARTAERKFDRLARD